MLTVIKKLSKVLPEDDVKMLESEVADLLKRAEAEAKTTCDAKEKELKSS